ncbi:hypothetical protein GCM10007860_06370 [Chitiniphilus shinanonensis]|uniref:Uncharacterized protein n=1 Tax=Chitiniphilus shinanonensis TaxID=553088 RepID=A0ABQ6BNJ8_9NEIS|nr:hypothetical protein GCM10007860_06370 [Chitiniphilus shinanonensis]
MTVFKHYVEQGNIPLFFTNSSEVLIEKVKEHPISEQHSIDVKGKNGAMLHIFCRDVKVGAQKIYVTLSGDEVAEQTFEVPIHTLHKFNFEGGVYRLRLDGVVDWKERADEAFISIVPLR